MELMIGENFINTEDSIPIVITTDKTWKGKTRVTSSNPRVTSSNPRVRRLKARVRRLKARIEAIKPRVK